MCLFKELTITIVEREIRKKINIKQVLPSSLFLVACEAVPEG